MRRVCFVTCLRWPEVSESDGHVRRALETRGVAVEARAWNDQPFVEEIRTQGEWSLVFIDGAFTHAVLKHPARHDFRVQPRLGGRAEAAMPPPSVLAAATRVLAALPLPPVYARIDGVECEGGFAVMEVELNEPGLFFTYAPAAAEHFADAICRRIG